MSINSQNGIELLEYVMSVSRRMAEMRSLEPLLSYTIDEVLKLVGAERGYIVLKTNDGSLDFRAKRDKDGNELPEGADEISHSILEEVIRTGNSLVLSNAMSDPRFHQAESVMILRLRSIMCVPLIRQKEVIGAIYVENRSIRGRFRQGDVAPLEIFANQAAVAIENAALNDNLEQANTHLRDLDELKNNFIRLISHELRTPLANVTAYADLMKVVIDMVEPAPDPQIVQTRQKLETAVLQMRKTIEEILHVFLIASGQLTLLPRPLSIGPIVASVAVRFADVCENRNLKLHVDDVYNLPMLMLDEDQIEVVFSNVLGNSVKYTPDGGDIWVSGRRVPAGVEITVRDTGIGIPKTEQKRVFDIFHVLGSLMHHSTSKHAFRGGGLGLGLPIAKGIIEGHGGTISLESSGQDLENPPGTTCRITLPLQRTN
ncbi:MAG: GAF domain-containing protein [Anaerolineales bacterium]|nr:GAF domain-containing protein [Anaerolineales bacterium]